MKPRRLKPFTELAQLTEADRGQLWDALNAGLTYDRAVLLLAKEHFAVIKRHRLYTWWHREDQRRALNAHLPPAHQIAAAEFLDLLNGQALPWSDLMHARILRAAFLLSNEEEQTPSKLLSLQRIANNEFHQEIAREKLDLEKRRQNLRELQAQAKNQSNSSAAATPRPSASSAAEAAASQTTVQPGPPKSANEFHPVHEVHADDDGGVTIGTKPFRMWTPEELAIKQPRVQAIIRAHPFLSQFVRPMIELPPTQLPPEPSQYSQEQESGDLRDVRTAIQEAIEQ